MMNRIIPLLILSALSTSAIAQQQIKASPAYDNVHREPKTVKSLPPKHLPAKAVMTNDRLKHTSDIKTLQSEKNALKDSTAKHP